MLETIEEDHEILASQLRHLMGLQVKKRFSFVDALPIAGTGFFSESDLKEHIHFCNEPGKSVDYWDILCMASQHMDRGERLYYYRTVMNVNKTEARKEFVRPGATWETLCEGYSRGISYSIDHNGTIKVYILDYSVATGCGIAGKLSELGMDRAHDNFALYPQLSIPSNMKFHKFIGEWLPNCYTDDPLISSMPTHVVDNFQCPFFKQNGIACGSFKDQAYQAIYPVLFHKPCTRVAVSAVAPIAITPSVLVGSAGEALIQRAIRHNRLSNIISNSFGGLLQCLYECNMNLYYFRNCGLQTNSCSSGLCYFLGTPRKPQQLDIE